MNFGVDQPSNIYVDSTAALANFGNTNIKAAVKHIAIDISEVRSFANSGEITKVNLADLMTKALPGEATAFHRDVLTIRIGT